MERPNNVTVVCLLDVLGFGSLLSSRGLSKVAELYAQLTGYVREQTGGLCIVPTPDGHVAVGWLIVGNAYFSDSILFWTDYELLRLSQFILLVAETVCYGIENELPLRGAITVGEMVLDSGTDTYLGEPIVEAARTVSLQRWIGVSLGVSFSRPGFNEGFSADKVLPYKNHYKSESDPLANGLVVDWPRRWRETRKADLREEVRRMDRSPEHSQYYSKTLEFIDFSERNHDWFKKQSHLGYCQGGSAQ